MKQLVYILFILLISTSAFTQITSYTDRAVWEADANGVCAFEDFEGFTVEADFKATAVTCNGFSLQRTMGGIDFPNFGNFIDILPVQGFAPNGSNFAFIYVNANDDTEVTMSLDNPSYGFFADFSSTTTGEILALMYNTSGGMINSHTFSMNNTSFGFISASEPVASIKFMSANINPSASGEGFGIDNVALSCAPPIPTMGQWALMILALLLSSIGIGYLVAMNTNTIAVRS